MDGIPPALPALLQALKVQKRAAGSGFGYASSGEALAEVERELGELVDDPDADELGDLLFAACGVAQHLGLDPEAALRSSAGRFQRRFRHVERLASEAGTALADVDPVRLDDWWKEAKAGD